MVEDPISHVRVLLPSGVVNIIYAFMAGHHDHRFQVNVYGVDFNIFYQHIFTPELEKINVVNEIRHYMRGAHHRSTRFWESALIC